MKSVINLQTASKTAPCDTFPSRFWEHWQEALYRSINKQRSENMKAHIMHLKPAFMSSHSFSLVCWVGLGGEGLPGKFKRIFSIWISGACVRVYFCPSAPCVSSAEPVRLRGHTYANQLLTVLPNAAREDSLGGFFVFHCMRVPTAPYQKQEYVKLLETCVHGSFLGKVTLIILKCLNHWVCNYWIMCSHLCSNYNNY